MSVATDFDSQVRIDQARALVSGLKVRGVDAMSTTQKGWEHVVYIFPDRHTRITTGIGSFLVGDVSYAFGGGHYAAHVVDAKNTVKVHSADDYPYFSERPMDTLVDDWVDIAIRVAAENLPKPTIMDRIRFFLFANFGA